MFAIKLLDIPRIKTVELLVMLWLFPTVIQAQKTEYNIYTVAFYNLENLFDTVNDSLVRDDERTPHGSYHWTKERYQDKLLKLATVIRGIGAPYDLDGPEIIGVCEVENADVLEDLITKPTMAALDYGYVHFDSPDERGIDVALLYKKEKFIPTAFKSHRLLLENEKGFRDYTRDQLVVSGILDTHPIHFLVNHWPSRRGGQSRSEPYRLAAAKLNKRIIDSLRREDREARIVAMGDFNDDPLDHSFKKVLKTQSSTTPIDSFGLYNPMERLYKKGIGSLAYRDRWSLFDQFYFTTNLLSKEGLFFWKAQVYRPQFLKNDSGRYKGYPFRTYAGNQYQGGYSDHFPIYLYLLAKVR
ncbi:endonuclease/exonuclease/phosphatase family protein [Sediminicola luteus]|uniref:Endonuclease n=1 Tax=Sediminicola luteus TaxID=319238 RepID=A0A2A4G4E1_9FLAO|nr:endonuclease/exonuclease/phosphatase family protein [Sediminicola luteus]PCE62834.1 endonuclease [Sediminicola luteus]